MTTPKKKNDEVRSASGYRHSDAFISKMTNWLVATVFIGPILGALISFIGYAITDGHTPPWVNVVAVAIALGGVILPLVVGAWFGGTAVHRYGGWVGLLLIAGMGTTVAGQTIDVGWLVLTGISAMVLAFVLFFYSGFQAKVPMWLQLPILNSPRAYITEGGKKQTNKRNVQRKNK